MLCYIHMLRFKNEASEIASYWSQFFYFITCCMELWEVIVPAMGTIQKLMLLSSKSGKEVEEERKKLWHQINSALLNSIRRIGDGITAIRDIYPEIYDKHRLMVLSAGLVSGVVSIYQSVPSLYNQK